MKLGLIMAFSISLMQFSITQKKSIELGFAWPRESYRSSKIELGLAEASSSTLNQINSFAIFNFKRKFNKSYGGKIKRENT